jgi:glycosyltransferase involved in cell wall biosynthesis
MSQDFSLESRSREGRKREIVLAHDYISQRGGAERVVIELNRAIKPDFVITSFYEPSMTFSEFRSMRIRTSVLNRLSFFRRDPRIAFPILAFIWSSFKPIDAKVVICSSSGWSHGIRVTKRTRKIVYCHNPARWLYQTEDYLVGLTRWGRVALRLLRACLKKWDQRAAASADLYIANSTSVAARIKSFYAREAVVLFPPVSIDIQGPVEPIPELTFPFYLTVGRARGYKGTERIVQAFSALPAQSLVVVGASALDDKPRNVVSLGHVDDAQLRWLYTHAKALVSVSREDFGLTPIEANAFGTPVLVLKAGGFLDTTNEGVSGRFIADDSVESICEAVREFPSAWDRTAIRAHASEFSQEKFEKRLMLLLCSDEAIATHS